MALEQPSAQLRDDIRELLKSPSLDYFYSSQFGSANSKSCNGWRERLQAEVENHIGDKKINYSISHSNYLGGAAYAADQVGFDIEETARVLPAVALRVSDEQQMRIAPSPAMLFVAKEAAFKSLRGPRQPRVLSEVEIISWQTHNFSQPLYYFTAQLKGQPFQWFGVCFEDSQTTVGISVFPHST